MTDQTKYIILCVDDSPQLLSKLVKDLNTLWHGQLTIETCTNATETLVWANLREKSDTHIPLIIIDHELPDMPGADLMIRLHAFNELRNSSKILLTQGTSLDFLLNALNHGALNGHLSRPWDLHSLRESTRHLLTEYFIEHAPDDMPRFSDIVDIGQISTALATSQRTRRAMSQELTALRKNFLDVRTLNDDQVETALIHETKRLLEQPPHLHYKQGQLLFQENDEVDGVYICLTGATSLFRNIDGQKFIFHSATVGRVLGMLAFTYKRKAFFSCRAESDATFIKIPHDTLDELLKNNPEFALYFMTVLMRASIKRNRRATELQIEIRTLNQTLDQEKTHLAQALDQLKHAQMRLVETEKMATLGQLVSGVAHELNNPIAAITRAADFTHTDLSQLAQTLPDHQTFSDLLNAGLTPNTQSTRQRRDLTKTLDQTLHDKPLAKRLIKIGILDYKTYQQHLPQQTPQKHEQRLQQLERYYNLGHSLQTIHTCANRIAQLVTSLRSYARADNEQQNNINLLQGLEETLALFAHKLPNITLEKNYQPLPPITCRPGQINQIWTNLISNAIHAMDGQGTLQINTQTLNDNTIQIQITDSGTGITPQNLQKIFDVNFTTKQGQIDFGLGLGLPICKEIIHRHHGHIHATSQPGQTTFTIQLPIHSPNIPQQETP